MNQYQSPIAIPPYETFRELLEEKGISREKLMETYGINNEYFLEIYNGEIRYDQDGLCELLANAFGVSKEFWINLEQNYQNSWKRLS